MPENTNFLRIMHTINKIFLYFCKVRLSVRFIQKKYHIENTTTIMNIARKFFYLLPALLLFSFQAAGQTLDADFSVSPTRGQRCMDSSFTFDAGTATTYTGSGTLTYIWSFGDATVGSNSAKQTKTYNATGKYKVKLIIKSSDNLIDSVEKEVTVHPLPKVDFSYSSNNCQREEMFFYDESVVSSGYVDRILWTFEPNRTSTAGTAIHVFNQAQKYNVKLEIWTDQGCYATVTKEVTIRPRPVANFTYTSRCQDTAISFDAGATTGTVSGYKWVFPDATTATSKTVSKKFAEPGQYTVRLVAYNATSGCHDSISKTVVVYDNPKVDFEVRHKCQDSTFFIVNKTKPTYGTVAEVLINWDKANPTSGLKRYKAPFTSDTIKNVYSPNPLKTYTIEITVRTTNGCEATKTYRADVRGKPKAAFTTAGGCLDSVITFIDKSTIPTGNAGSVAYWFWNFGDSTNGVPNTSTLQNPTHKYQRAGTYKVSLRTATDAGCFDEVKNQLVEVFPAPNAYFVFASDCKNKPILFQDTSTISSGTVNAWYWNFGDPTSGSANTSTSKSPSHTFSKPGEYTVTMVAYSDKGCKDTFRSNVIIFQDAIPDFSYTGTCERTMINFSDKSTPPVGGSIINYEWDFGDGDVDKTNSKNVAHAYKNSGRFTVKLTVVTAEGCPVTVSKDVIVIPSPKASFTNTPTCINKEVAFNNTTTIVDPNITVTYSWNFGDPASGVNNTSTLRNPTHTFTVGKQYTVKMVATSSNGCKDSVIKVIEAATVPVADFTFTNLCNDSAMLFTDQSTISGSVITQRIWYWNDNSSPETGNNKNPSHKFPAAGKYNVSLVTVTVAGCRDSVTKTVETYPSPKADYTYISYCADTAIQFINSSAMENSTDTVYAYKWLFGDGEISYQKNPSHLYKSGGAYNVVLSAYSPLGCKNDITKVVNVKNRPQPAFSAVGVGGNRCATRQINFNDQSTSDVVSWFWDFGDGETATTKSPSHIYKDAGTYNVKLTVKNNNGCDSTIAIDVVVNELPVVKLGWTGGCAGEPITFRDSSTTQSGKRRGAIQIPAKGFASVMPANGRLIYTGFGPNDAGEYDVIFTSTDMPNGSGGDAGCENKDTFKVRIYPKPEPTMTSDIVCFGEPTTIVGISDAEDGIIASWKWSFKDGRTVTTTTNTVSHVFKVDGVDTVTLTVTNVAGCVSTIKSIVNILPTPVASFTMKPNPVSNLNPTVTFKNTTQNFVSHSWDFGDGFVSNELNPTHKYLSVGKYPVTLIVQNQSGCRDTLIDTLHVKQDYVIHIPNAVTPNGDDINDTWKPDGEGIENYELIIMNRWGQVLFQTNDMKEAWKCDTNGNGVLVPEGVYIYYIRIVDFEVEKVDTRKGFIQVIR